jgi:predicted MFS family arabinose efflux permease
MAAIVYALVRAPSVGWGSGQTWGALVAAAVLLGLFAVIESRTERPLLRLSFLRHRNRAGGYAVMMLFGGSMLSLLFFLTQFLQEEMHYSSLRAGVSYLPVPFMVATTSVILSKRIRRVGLRPFLVMGPLLVAAGILWASLLQPGDSYWHVFGPLVTFGLGAGLSVVPLTLNAVSSVAEHEQGLASSLLNTSQQIGGSLGLAVLATIGATTRTHDLARGLSNSAAATAAMHNALRVAGLSSLVAFAIAVLVIRPVRAAAAPTPHPVTEVVGQA